MENTPCWNFVPQRITVMTPIKHRSEMARRLEYYGRVCYNSRDRITDVSYQTFITNIIKNGHESVLEHESITVEFFTNRAIANAIVRHRIGSYSQTSTRYCSYTDRVEFIKPFYLTYQDEFSDAATLCHTRTLLESVRSYQRLINYGVFTEQARGVLPLDLATTLVTTYNIREWRHFFRLRGSRRAHPQMRQLAISLLLFLQKHVEILFDDIPYDESFPQEHLLPVRFKEGGGYGDADLRS